MYQIEIAMVQLKFLNFVVNIKNTTKMKKLLLILSVTAVIFISCDDKKKDLSAQYDTLMTESDKIEMAHQKFEEVHKSMMGEHQKFSEEVEGMEVQDSTLLGDVAKHGVILKKHDAIIESHAAIIEGHKKLKTDFDNLNAVEMEAEIKQMKKDHDKMMEEHSSMEDEHEMMMKEHKDLKERMVENMEEQ